MNKKAAIELSVTAIVVLILAIVILGLALGFIKGMFGKAAKGIEQQVIVEPEPPAPSASEPITLSREKIITNAGEKETVKVSTFNPTDGAWDDKNPTVSCTGLGVSASSNPKDIAQGKYETFTILLTIPSSSSDTYLCRIGMEGYTKDITIEITE